METLVAERTTELEHKSTQLEKTASSLANNA
jgi:hypothetical protein